MDRDQEGVAAVLAIAPMLYLAWLLSWLGTFATTCTGGDPKSLGAGMILSVLFYAAGIFCLQRSSLGVGGLLLALPLCLLLLRQGAWAVELFVDVNIDGHSACNLIMGEGFGEARGGWLEQTYSIYYFGISIISLWAIGYSHWRYHLEKSW